MYVCGPTVYDDCHIGHVVGPVLFDSIAKWMQQTRYEVNFINNITDIDDKIIQRANNTGEPWKDITKRYTQQYFDLLGELGVSTVSQHPRATDFIDEMITYISDLVDRDKAYALEDGVYFAIADHPGYGKLSGRNADDMKAGARIDRTQGLRHPGDFCLWKLAKPGEPSWPSPWGEGRPGWHIECSVMSSSILGDTFDIHGGGDDLKFPHHENEIAQGEAHGGEYAKCWMHNGLVQYEGAKISKSDPRMKDAEFSKQFKALYLVETYGGDTMRFLMLRGHYRRPIDFAPEQLQAAEKSLRRLQRQVSKALGDASIPQNLAEVEALEVPASAVANRDRFIKAMDDDFNTGAAISECFSLAGQLKKANGEDAIRIAQLIAGLGGILGLQLVVADATASAAPSAAADAKLDDALMALILDLRQEARQARLCHGRRHS